MNPKRSLMILMALAIWSLPSMGADRSFHKSFTVSPGGTLTLNTDVGSLSVEGSAGNEVRIEAILRGSRSEVEDFEISAEQVSDGVEVKGKSHGGFFRWGNNIDAKFTITVPHEYHLRLRTSGGDITVANTQGRIAGGTSGGDIVLKDIKGPVKLGTSGGDIRAERAVGDIEMETSGGDIHIVDVAGAVDVHTSGGSIVLKDVDGKVRAKTSGGNVTVKLHSVNKGVYAETSGGNIDVMVGKNISANIDASTSGGDVVCDLPVTVQGRIDESRVRGTVNGGGEIIHAHTSGGNVRIKALE